MSKRFVYFYLMKRIPEKIQATVPAHVIFWKDKNLAGYRGGPFSDRSGGLITFEAENLDEASRIILNDPFFSEGLIDNKYVKEWMEE